ncbi:MAG TPA: hypothetical protein IAD34_05915 [Candidatus Scatovicinus merdipullorum]|nr:hypothetical protein [Candidatus Scatovicinus merdipullorum]
MKFYRLFGNHIDPNCTYCDHCIFEQDQVQICRVKREIKNGKCRRFQYNPLLRVPKQMPALPKYDPKDFEL